MTTFNTETFDYLGQPLFAGDYVVFLKNCRTGSSTTRKLMFRGQITELYAAKVNVVGKCKEWHNDTTCEFTVCPHDVVKVNWMSIIAGCTGCRCHGCDKQQSCANCKSCTANMYVEFRPTYNCKGYVEKGAIYNVRN